MVSMQEVPSSIPIRAYLAHFPTSFSLLSDYQGKLSYRFKEEVTYLAMHSYCCDGPKTCDTLICYVAALGVTAI